METKTHCFVMNLSSGDAETYQRRHDDIPEELVQLLREAGVSDYSIYLDETTGMLFGILQRAPDHRMDELAENPTMKKWWAQMKDLMETHSSNEPVTRTLRRVFHMK